MIKERSFVLDVANVTKVVQQLQQEFKDIEFKIWQSNTSTSVYVKINYGDKVRLIRIADHPNKRASAKTIIVGKSTKYNKIYSTMKNTIRDLKDWQLKELYNNLQENKKQ